LEPNSVFLPNKKIDSFESYPLSDTCTPNQQKEVDQQRNSESAKWDAWEDDAICHGIHRFGKNWDLLSNLLSKPFGMRRSPIQIYNRFCELKHEDSDNTSEPARVGESELLSKGCVEWEARPLHVDDLLLSVPPKDASTRFTSFETTVSVPSINSVASERFCIESRAGYKNLVESRRQSLCKNRHVSAMVKTILHASHEYPTFPQSKNLSRSSPIVERSRLESTGCPSGMLPGAVIERIVQNQVEKRVRGTSATGVGRKGEPRRTSTQGQPAFTQPLHSRAAFVGLRTTVNSVPHHMQQTSDIAPVGHPVTSPHAQVTVAAGGGYGGIGRLQQTLHNHPFQSFEMTLNSTQLARKNSSSYVPMPHSLGHVPTQASALPPNPYGKPQLVFAPTTNIYSQEQTQNFKRYRTQE
jgi:hypothetical protein